MSIWNFLSGAINPITKLVDELHTSDEERLIIKAELAKLQNDITEKVLDYESQLLDSKTSIIVAEAQGASWLQRSWRPITMLTFLLLVVMDTFGWTAFRLSEEAWVLLQIGLGGYVAGRTVEKVTPAVADMIKKR
jgi:hypothetical protein